MAATVFIVFFIREFNLVSRSTPSHFLPLILFFLKKQQQIIHLTLRQNYENVWCNYLIAFFAPIYSSFEHEDRIEMIITIIKHQYK